MSSHHPFGHLKHKLWPKERLGIKLAVWLPTTKSQESTRFPCAQVACNILLESSQWGIQLCFKPHLHQRSARNVMALQSYGSPNFGNSGLPLGSPKTKSHLDVGLVERRRVYYKGEGGGFPQVRAVVSLVNLNCPWFVLAPKVLQLCTNHFVLVLCNLVWVSKACQIFLVPSWSSSTPFYPSKVLRARERASTPYPFVVFYLGLTFESFKELGAIFMDENGDEKWQWMKFLWTFTTNFVLQKNEQKKQEIYVGLLWTFYHMKCLNYISINISYSIFVTSKPYKIWNHIKFKGT
jgi:hypothetical protein